MSKAAELANLIGNINMGGGGVNRNIFINGAMNVFQRGTSETGIGGSEIYVADRFEFVPAGTTAGRLTATQDSSAPEGFANSLKLACTTADTSISASEGMLLVQRVEGQNLQTFAKGTSDAKPFAVSFYVKGNASATFTCELFDGDNTRQISKQFNVTTDWTRVELSFPADTTGAFNDDNAESLFMAIWLHAGSDFTSGTLNSSAWASNTNANRVGSISSFFDSTDRTFFITGVQLEVGQNPTEFEHEPFANTLRKCQRYFRTFGGNSGNERVAVGFYYSSTGFRTVIPLSPEMRATPTLAVTTDSQMHVEAIGGSASNSGHSLDQASPKAASINVTTSHSKTAGQAGQLMFNGSDNRLTLEAEL